MYERPTTTEKRAILKSINKGFSTEAFSSRTQNVGADSDAGDIFAHYVKSGRADSIRHQLDTQSGSGPIGGWLKKYGMAVEPISELASLSQAYCSIFWDPNDTWMVVAFK